VVQKLSDNSFRLPVMGFVLLWMIFQVWVLHQYYAVALMTAVWDSVIFNICLISAALVTGYFNTYSSRTGGFQFIAGLSVLLAFAVEWIAYQALAVLMQDDAAYLELLKQSEPVRWVVAFLLIASSGLLKILYERWKETQEAYERESTTQVMVREAELQKLQLQLQPHFLFNSLNSINALIITQPDQAGTMVQQLSDFLRATLKRADEKWITLRQELDYLELYLSIEKVRFGHRLDVRMHIDEQMELWLIPPLLLQPLVENAIKFGLYGTTGKVVIHFFMKREGDSLLVEITNPFDQDVQPAEGSGFGLAGLKRRLYLLYARNDLLTTRVEENHFIVQLLLPENYD
jgi:two-component system, LytTR family, sensor kinase